MFCSNCGQEAPEGAKNCPNCGAPLEGGDKLDNLTKDVKNAFDNAEKELGSAVQDIHQTISNAGAPYAGEKLQTDRGLLAYIVLTIITCGIYSYYFIYKMAHDVNIACEGDGESTGGLVKFIVLSIITCGIYAWVWYYKLGNRLSSNAGRYGLTFQENGTTVLLWLLFGAMLCGIGPFIAMNILIKNTNKICEAYNQQHGLM